MKKIYNDLKKQMRKIKNKIKLNNSILYVYLFYFI